MDVKFGTSGLRGKSDDLLDGAAAAYTRAFCDYCRRAGHSKDGDAILVARDLRESSPQITSLVLAKIHKCGFVPVDCGAVPTPALAYYAMARNAPSIMVTGSHIPADRNGLKFYLPEGEIDKDDEIAISKLAADQQDNSDARSADTQASFAKTIQAEVIANFRRRYQDFLPSQALRGLSIGIYEHSSVAVPVLRDLLESFGASTVGFGRSKTFTPVDTEALSDQTVELLTKNAADLNLDAIISTDADGDRPLIADRNGIQIPGDLAGCITAAFIGAHAVATPVTSNSAINSHLKFEVVRTRVGSPYVIAAMQEITDRLSANGEKIVAGFEANGGFLLATPASVNGQLVTGLPTRDCILPILAVLARIASEGADRLRESIGFKNTCSGRIADFPQAKSKGLMGWLGESKENMNNFMTLFGGLAEVDTTDGFRISTLDDRIIHLRPSGNAPEMRIYCEAENDEAAEALFDQVRSEVTKFNMH